MNLARTSDHSQVKSYYQHYLEGTTPPPATGAVNLALIATSPQQLQPMAEAEENPEGQRGASATEHHGQGVGPSPTAPQTGPEGPRNAPKDSVQPTNVQEPPPAPGSQAWHSLRLEELARLRAEWRRLR